MVTQKSSKLWLSPLASSGGLLLIALSMLACSGSSKSVEAGAATGGTSSGPVANPATPMMPQPMPPKPVPPGEMLRPPGEGQISCRPVAPVAVVPTVGKMLHVAMTGADTNDGSAAMPFATIQKASDLAMPGDTVLVHEGIYRGRVAPMRGGVAGMPITYLAEPGKQVTLKGSQVWTPTWEPVSGGDNLWKAAPDPALFTDASQIDGANPLLVTFAHIAGLTLGQVYVDSERMVQMEALPDTYLRPGTWHYQAADMAIYVHFPEGKTPQAASVELTTERRVFAPHTRGLGYITLSGFTVEHCANQYPGGFYDPNATAEQQAGMVGTRSGNHWVLENNVLRFAQGLAFDCGGEGEVSGKVDLEGKDQTRIRTTDGHIIRNNVFMDNGTGGYMSMGGNGTLTENNVFLRNNLLDPGGAELAAIKVHYTNNFTYKNNLFLDNNTFGIYTDAGSRAFRITQNVFVGNKIPVFVELGRLDSPTLVDNNVLIDNFYNSIYNHDTSAAYVAHNLIYKTTGANAFLSHGEGYFQGRVTTRVKDAGSNFTLNNLMGASEGGALSVPYPCGMTTNNRTDYNVYAETLMRPYIVNVHCPATGTPTNTPFDTTEALQTKILGELGAAAPASASQLRIIFTGVGMNMTEWKAFWQFHNEPHDAHSLESAGMTASIDRKTFKAQVNVDFDPATFGSEAVAGITTDFFGAPIPQDGKAKPGPFQNLVHGQNEFQVFKCAPE